MKLLPEEKRSDNLSLKNYLILESPGNFKGTYGTI